MSQDAKPTISSLLNEHRRFPPPEDFVHRRSRLVRRGARRVERNGLLVRGKRFGQLAEGRQRSAGEFPREVVKATGGCVSEDLARECEYSLVGGPVFRFHGYRTFRKAAREAPLHLLQV